MAKTKSNKISLICIIIGAVLITASIGYMAFSMFANKNAVADNKKIVSVAETLIPTPRDSFPEERGNNNMPSLEVEGVNIAGILEIPSFESKLPIRAVWSDKEVDRMPCIYTGSIYNRTLVIGTVNSSGMLNFADKLELDDIVNITDTEGSKYSYSITSIKHANSFNADKWQAENAALTLFVKDAFSGEYTVFYCNTK